MIKSDRWIARMAKEEGMIEPFVNEQVRNDVISYGLSSYGYDIRISDEFQIFSRANPTTAVVDPKNFDKELLQPHKGDYCIIPPNSFVLAKTIETFRIPDDVLTICVGKSSYARCGVAVHVTPFEPGWVGEATIEIANATPLPVKIYANEGIAQVLFFQSDEKCSVSYADKNGKYQNQKGVQIPIMEK